VYSSASFGSAISVIGLLATVPLGGVGGCFAWQHFSALGLVPLFPLLACRLQFH